MLDMFIGGFRAPDYGHFKGICMSVALWIVLLVCVLWIALSEMPAGWDGHLPLPYLIALTPLLWIPTLAIAIAGAVRHDTALAIVAAIAFDSFHEIDEGGLTRIKVALVAGSSLSDVAAKLGFADIIVFGSSETGTGKRG